MPAEAKSRRIEVRTDDETMKLVAEAADLLHVSKTTFIMDAVRQEAYKVIGRSDVTLMSAEVFDAMMSSIDRPDESPELAELAALPRRIVR